MSVIALILSLTIGGAAFAQTEAALLVSDRAPCTADCPSDVPVESAEPVPEHVLETGACPGAPDDSCSGESEPVHVYEFDDSADIILE